MPKISRFYGINGKNRTIMIPRIKHIETLDDYKLLITFDDGLVVCYDVRKDIDAVEDFKSLETVVGLWQQVKLDSSRTCVYWNDRFDIASDTIYEYGKPVISI